MQKSTIEIRFAGMGGQGLVKAGEVLAKASSIYENKFGAITGMFAIQTECYGPEARGGATKSDVKISESEIYSLDIEKPDILVVMSGPAFEKFSKEVKEETIFVIDPDTVKSRPSNKFYEIKATESARQLGKTIVANIIMLGALVEIFNFVSKESLKKALIDSFPKEFSDINLKALERGFELGKIAKNRK